MRMRSPAAANIANKAVCVIEPHQGVDKIIMDTAIASGTNARVCPQRWKRKPSVTTMTKQNKMLKRGVILGSINTLLSVTKSRVAIANMPTVNTIFWFLEVQRFRRSSMPPAQKIKGQSVLRHLMGIPGASGAAPQPDVESVRRAHNCPANPAPLVETQDQN